ncbi:MAG: hypothetical protein JNN13_17145 [Planctomycetes bacterium]|nr:hypothetical protein [Planctomycetota bacterium]
MRVERRRFRGFFANLVDDPYRKLAAVGLGFMLWLFIDRQITSSCERSLPLTVVGLQGASGPVGDRLAVQLPTDRVVELGFFNGEQALENVRATLRGPKYRIDALREQQIALTISAFLSRDWSVNQSVEFTAADLGADQLPRGVTIEFDPPRLRLDVERIGDTTIRLDSLERVDLVADQGADRLILASARFNPEEAVVLGTAKQIQEFKKRTGKLFRAVAHLQPNAKQVSVRLDLIADAKTGLRLEQSPLLTIDVRPEMQLFTIEVPMLVDDTALPEELRGRFKLEQRSRQVRIQAAGALKSELITRLDSQDKGAIADWAAENLRLLLMVPRPEPGAALGATIDVNARLLIVGKILRTQVDRSEYQLDEQVVVTLRQTPP